MKKIMHAHRLAWLSAVVVAMGMCPVGAEPIEWVTNGTSDFVAKRTLQAGKIDVSNRESGEYELYFIATTTIPRGGQIAFDSWWGVSESLAPYYPEGDEHREFEIWASLKFVGPSFGIETEDNKDRMFCDQLFLVDRKAEPRKQAIEGQSDSGGVQ